MVFRVKQRTYSARARSSKKAGLPVRERWRSTYSRAGIAAIMRSNSSSGWAMNDQCQEPSAHSREVCSHTYRVGTMSSSATLRTRSG